MANIFDYLIWRGDLSFLEAPFNEIDNLILSRVSYFPFDNTIEENECITIKEAYEKFEKLDKQKIHILQKEDIDLFPALAKSERFANLKLKKYINKIDIKSEKQFSAITIILPDNTAYISYRGTDNTLVGWKEDLNMSFMDLVPSQIDAVNYLNNLEKEIKGDIRVGGHSKGGNLAVYAAAFCLKKIKNKIIQVYNNDGPGFCKKIIESNEYIEILPKIHTFIPQSSVVGRLLNHEEKYTVVESTQVGLLQHDLYSWQVLGGNFVTLEEVTNGSQIVDKTIKEWLKSISPEERGKFLDILFEILNSTDAKTLSEMSSNWFASAKAVLTTYKNLDSENKEIIIKTITSLMNIAKRNVLARDKKQNPK